MGVDFIVQIKFPRTTVIAKSESPLIICQKNGGLGEDKENYIRGRIALLRAMGC
jgi:hypothetical protein